MDVKEGFLCPMCLQDLKSFHNLQSHFDSAHSIEDKAVVTQIKGLFSKAKDKILGKEYEEDDQRNPFSSSQMSADVEHAHQAEFDPSFWDPQEIGATRTHMDRFKFLRDARIDRVVIETNKIVIRLDKMLRLEETDYSKRKEFEQSLVPWAEDEDVPFCPTCGDKFNIAKRRHHCRLCGAVMCTNCSIFLPFVIAADIVKSVNNAIKSSPEKRNIKFQQQPSLPEELADKLCVRICFECDKVLQRNKEKLDRHQNPTLLVKLFEKMRKAMTDAVKYTPDFVVMAESLNVGKEDYKLDIANEKRFQLLQMFEAIDVISKKIAALNSGDEENPIPPGELRLQATIRRAAYTFLQENMLSLPSLPSQPKLQVLQAKRRAENERRLRKQREEALRQREEEKRRQEMEELRREREAIAREQQMVSSALEDEEQQQSSAFLLKDPGWSADAVSVTSNTYRHSKQRNWTFEDEDEVQGSSSSTKDDSLSPLWEQIQYVRESAKQARAAGMHSEADSLERNMQELEREYKKQKTARAFAVVTPTTSPSPGWDKTAETSSVQRNFRPSGNSGDTGEDPLLQQIRYVTKCIEEARSAGKYDEMVILEENLEDLKKLYNGADFK